MVHFHLSAAEGIASAPVARDVDVQLTHWEKNVRGAFGTGTRYGRIDDRLGDESAIEWRAARGRGPALATVRPHVASEPEIVPGRLDLLFNGKLIWVLDRKFAFFVTYQMLHSEDLYSIRWFFKVLIRNGHLINNILYVIII